MSKYLDETGLTTLWTKIKTYVANAFSAVTQTTTTTYRTLKFTKLGGSTASVTLSAATTSAAGLMTTTDKTNLTNLLHLQGTQSFYRKGQASVSYLSLFSVTPTTVSVGSYTPTAFPIVEFELVVVSAGTSTYVCAAYKCTLCLSSTPTITWQVQNTIGGAVANAVKSIVYDKTNKIVLVGVDSSSSYLTNMHLKAFVYRNDHCTVAASTTTTTVSSSIATFFVESTLS